MWNICSSGSKTKIEGGLMGQDSGGRRTNIKPSQIDLAKILWIALHQMERSPNKLWQGPCNLAQL